jgi:tripartite motif-containing protein 71
LGSEGSTDGEFHEPGDIAIDSSGNVYVGDYNNHRIQVFAPKLNE